MSDYFHYKQCMDEARKLTQEADDLMGPAGTHKTGRKQKCEALLEKADKLRKLAMQYAFDGRVKGRNVSDTQPRDAASYEKIMATTANGKPHQTD